jgi:hypothetical protein
LDEAVRFDSAQTQFLKGEFAMKISLPKTISGWCMWLFFLWVGLSAFIPFFASLAIVSGILALGYAVFSFLGM